PIPLEDFLSRHKREMESAMQSVRKTLSQTAAGVESISIWNILDYDFLIEKAKGMIDGASRTVLISIWRDELEKIEDNVRGALDRGVKIAVLHFGQSRVKLGKLYQHPIEDTVFQEKGGRCITVVSDSQEVLIGTVLRYGTVEGAWSRNRSFITMAEEYIKHDIYIMKIVARFDRLLKERFGMRYENLRDVFTDKEVQ
ncbi:MAG TPA: TrmB family transcriptional regulator sugar-binding domain-containing protein, partial [Thermodesulfovibrionales bacterium]|nr:TrmB family transcriptional regulator sugar-binding domain-containing protein [Thermodesulfovibrionales bacterium]